MTCFNSWTRSPQGTGEEEEGWVCSWCHGAFCSLPPITQCHSVCQQYILPPHHGDSQHHRQERQVWRTPFLQSCASDEAGGGRAPLHLPTFPPLTLSSRILTRPSLLPPPAPLAPPLSLPCQVIRTTDTSEETFQSLMEFSKAMKKVPVVCKVSVAMGMSRSCTHCCK